MADLKFSCPYCRQSMEGPAEMAGQIIDCPNCAKPIELRPPMIAKHFASGRSATTAAGTAIVETNVKQGAVIGGTLCLVVGLLLMIFSLLWFFIYVPLFLAAFVLSIIAMAQKRIWSGLAVLLFTCIVPGALFFFLSIHRAANAVVQLDAAMEQNREEMRQAMHTVAKDLQESPKRAALEFEDTINRAFEKAVEEANESPIE